MTEPFNAQLEKLRWALMMHLDFCVDDHPFYDDEDFPYSLTDSELVKLSCEYLGDDTVNKILDEKD